MPRPCATGTCTQTRSFTWTGTDLTASTNPENGTVTYQYDGAHHVTQRTDAKGQVTQYTYDTYGRLTAKRVFIGGTEQGNQDVFYDYDTNPIDGTYSQNVWGRLASVRFATQYGSYAINYQYSYNQAGRVTGQRFQGWADLQAVYGWDNEGRMTSMSVPQGATYGYSYDAMGHLATLTENGTQIASATYNVADQLATLTYDGVTESRTYNPLQQLTRMTTTSGASVWMDMQYVFPAGQNNGKVSQTIDNVTGEQVTYAYDSLNRLISATTANGLWGTSYSYDGFGNLTAKTPTQGSAPSFSATFDPATNRQIGQLYDANGNALPTSNSWFDVENRYITNGTDNYAYDPFGKRVTHQVNQTGYFYSITGQRVATYSLSGNAWVLSSVNVHFGGKILRSNGVPIATDRSGTVRANANGERMAYYPYGEERTSTADGREKFGTYFRDGIGQDYAGQRYYSSINGRFWSPDPAGLRIAKRTNPLSWNRYLYSFGDPVNFFDPAGTSSCDPDTPGYCDEDEQDCGYSFSPCSDDSGGSGGGTPTVTSTPALPRFPQSILVQP